MQVILVTCISASCTNVGKALQVRGKTERVLSDQLTPMVESRIESAARSIRLVSTPLSIPPLPAPARL